MFRELYFWMYSYVRKMKSNDNPPENAYYLIVSLQVLNIVMIGGIIKYFLEVELERGTAILLAVALGVLLLIVNHFTLYKKREEIFDVYDNHSTERKKKGRIFFWAYVLISVFLFFYIASITVVKQN